jgi:hypothetical protein
MTNLTQPGAGAALQLRALAAHEELDGGMLADAPELPGLRALIRESWQRSAGLKANPGQPGRPAGHGPG